MSIDGAAILFYYFVVSSSGPQFYCKKEQFNKASTNFVFRLPPVVAVNDGYLKTLLYIVAKSAALSVNKLLTNFEIW